jgi:hypothetical protein
MAHAKLGPSGAHRWLNCTGSVKACENLADKGSAAALEGSIAHELGDATLSRDKMGPTARFISTALDQYPDHIITLEMADYIQIYVDYVRNLGGDQFYEVRCDYSSFVPDGFGTSDAIVLVGRTLYVIDLKYGKGLKVFAENNEQAQLYALGALIEYDYLDIEKVVCVIVQPRLDHIDEWVTTPDALYKFGEYASQKAEEALSGSALRVAGEKQCKFCPAKPTCPALKKLTEDTILTHFEDLDIKPLQTLGDKQLRQAIENRKLIISWLDAVELLVVERLREGKLFEGYKLVAGRSTRQWFSESATEIFLVEELGEKAFAPKKVLSVTQAEKALGKSKKVLMDKFVVKPAGKSTLVPESDKRPAISISVDDFEKIE